VKQVLSFFSSNSFLELLASRKGWRFGGGDVDRLASSRVAPLSGLSIACLETAKPYE
jgi:hypothetical protein